MGDRYQIITWQRGYHSIVDTSVPIGDPNRFQSVPHSTSKRDIEARIRRMNRAERARRSE